MFKPFAASLLALAALAAPAMAHDGPHSLYQKLPNPLSGDHCAYSTETQNMERIEQTFRGMPQATRMNLQHVLRHTGLYAGRDDGIWGKMTECAIASVAARYPAKMDDKHLVWFFEYLVDGGFTEDYPGTPNPYPMPGVLY